MTVYVLSEVDVGGSEEIFGVFRNYGEGRRILLAMVDQRNAVIKETNLERIEHGLDPLELYERLNGPQDEYYQDGFWLSLTPTHLDPTLTVDEVGMPNHAKAPSAAASANDRLIDLFGEWDVDASQEPTVDPASLRIGDVIYWRTPKDELSYRPLSVATVEEIIHMLEADAPRGVIGLKPHRSFLHSDIEWYPMSDLRIYAVTACGFDEGE